MNGLAVGDLAGHQATNPPTVDVDAEAVDWRDSTVLPKDFSLQICCAGSIHGNVPLFLLVLIKNRHFMRRLCVTIDFNCNLYST